MAGSREKAPVVAADMRGSDSSRLRGEQQLKEGAHGGNPVSPVLTSAPPRPELVFEQMSAEDILRWGFDEVGAKPCETRDGLVARYDLELQGPQVLSVAEPRGRGGPSLWEVDPGRCCHIRKVEPLIEALKLYGAWISGIRRDQSPSRSGTPKLQ